MTESEAREKWCPFAASRMYPHNQVNEQGNTSTACIASACMAWRWAYDSEYLVFLDNEGNRFEANTLGRLHEAEQQGYKPLIPTDGYCGLAGKP